LGQAVLQIAEAAFHHCQNGFSILGAFIPDVTMGEAYYDAAAKVQQEATRYNGD